MGDARGVAALHDCCRTRSGSGPRPPRHAHDAQQHRALDRRDGDAREALRLFAELLPDQERVLGRDHPDTLTTRNNIADWTGRVGDAREALRLFAELLPDRERVLGRDHPDTLRTQEAIKLLESAASLSQDERIEQSGSLVRRLVSWWKRPR